MYSRDILDYVCSIFSQIIIMQLSRFLISLFLLVAGEKGTLFTLEELLPSVAVPVVPTQALHVSRAELTELTSEDAVWSIVSYCRATRC